MARETIAGITTFFTMAYIVIVNPAILFHVRHGHAVQRCAERNSAGVQHDGAAHGATQGILWGVILHAGLHALTSRAREVGAVVWALEYAQ